MPENPLLGGLVIVWGNRQYCRIPAEVGVLKVFEDGICGIASYSGYQGYLIPGRMRYAAQYFIFFFSA